LADPDGAVRRLESVPERPRKARERRRVGSDVDRVALRDDDEDAGVTACPAVGCYDRIPLARPRDPRDPGLDPAERPGISEVAAQESWGSISP